MTSHNDTAWCSQRFKEATLDDQPFGGIPVVCWVGDHGQLGPDGAGGHHKVMHHLQSKRGFVYTCNLKMLFI